MSIYETSITNSKKQLEFYKQLSEQLQRENQQLKSTLEMYENGVYFSSENDKLKDNWNRLKNFLEDNWKETQDIWFVKIINKMQELERGVSNVED